MSATNAGQVAVAAGPFARRARKLRTVKPCGPGTSTLVSSEWSCDVGLAAETQTSIRDGG
jgi:hypothetical protein